MCDDESWFLQLFANWKDTVDRSTAPAYPDDNFSYSSFAEAHSSSAENSSDASTEDVFDEEKKEEEKDLATCTVLRRVRTAGHECTGSSDSDSEGGCSGGGSSSSKRAKSLSDNEYETRLSFELELIDDTTHFERIIQYYYMCHEYPPSAEFYAVLTDDDEAKVNASEESETRNDEFRELNDNSLIRQMISQSTVGSNLRTILFLNEKGYRDDTDLIRMYETLNEFDAYNVSLEAFTRLINLYDVSKFATNENIIRSFLTMFCNHLIRNHRVSMLYRLRSMEPYLNGDEYVLSTLLSTLNPHFRAIPTRLFADFVVPLLADTCAAMSRYEASVRANERTTNVVGWCASIATSFLTRVEIELITAQLIHHWILTNCERLVAEDINALRRAFSYARERNCPHICAAMACFAREDTIREWENAALNKLKIAKNTGGADHRYDQGYVNRNGMTIENFTTFIVNRTAAAYDRRAAEFVRATRSTFDDVTTCEELPLERCSLDKFRKLFDNSGEYLAANDDEGKDFIRRMNEIRQGTRALSGAVYRFVDRASYSYERPSQRPQWPWEVRNSSNETYDPDSLQRLATYAILRSSGYLAPVPRIPRYIEHARRILQGWMDGYLYTVSREHSHITEVLYIRINAHRYH